MPPVDDLSNDQGAAAKVIGSTVAESGTPSAGAAVNAHLAANSGVVSDPAHPAFNIAAFYPVVRPVLLVAEGILFFQPTWAAAIKALVGALDALTNTNQQ